MKFGGEAESVDRVCALINTRCGIGQVVKNEADAIRDRPVMDVGRGNRRPSCDEFGRDLGSVPDPDLDDIIVRCERLDE